MATNFPAATDDNTSLPNPAGGSYTNSPSHAGLHDNENDAIKAIQAKVGTGASTPAAGTVFKGTGSGTSIWGSLAESDIVGLVADLAAKAPTASPTFTGSVTVPAPVNPTDAVTKTYVDTMASSEVTLTGVQTLTNKTMSGANNAFSSIPLAAVPGVAADSAVVHNTGAETIAGVKTFSSAPVVPSSSFPESAVTNLTTDLAAKATDSLVVHLAGAETVTGAKTFGTKLVVQDNGAVAGDLLVINNSLGSSFVKFTNLNTDAVPNGAMSLYRGATNAGTFQATGTNGLFITTNNGTGYIDFANNGVTTLRLAPVASPVNYFQMYQAATGNPALLAAVGGDANIGLSLLPKGAGTIGLAGPVTGLQDKGGQVFNVKAYGALGDGSTNDSAAVTAAINAASAAGGGIVYFPPVATSYKLTTTITLKSNVTIYGPPGTLITGGIGSSYIFQNLNPTVITDAAIIGLTIDLGSLANAAGIRVEYGTRIVLQNLNIKNVGAGGWGIVFGALGTDTAFRNFDILVDNCNFDTCAGTLEQLLMLNTQRAVIRKCNFNNMTNVSGHSIGLYQRLDSIVVEDNTFTPVTGQGMYYSLSCNNVIIKHNNFIGGGTAGNGIQGANESDNGKFGETWARNYLFEGNRIEGFISGMQLGAIKNAKVIGNHFENNVSNALQVFNGNSPANAQPTGYVISGNTFKNNNTGNNAQVLHPGLFFTGVGGSQYGLVENNTFVDDQKKTAADGAMTASSAVLTSATIGFSISDVGKNITVAGAGGAGALLTTTVASFTSTTSVTLATTASTTVSGAAVNTLATQRYPIDFDGAFTWDNIVIANNQLSADTANGGVSVNLSTSAVLGPNVKIYGNLDYSGTTTQQTLDVTNYKTAGIAAKSLLGMPFAQLSPSFNSVANTTTQVVGNLLFALPIIPKTCTVKITIQFYSGFGAGNTNVYGSIGPNSNGLANTTLANVYAGGATANPIYSNEGVITLDLSTQQYASMTVQNDASTVISFSANAFRTALLVEVYG